MANASTLGLGLIKTVQTQAPKNCLAKTSVFKLTFKKVFGDKCHQAAGSIKEQSFVRIIFVTIDTVDVV